MEVRAKIDQEEYILKEEDDGTGRGINCVTIYMVNDNGVPELPDMDIVSLDTFGDALNEVIAWHAEGLTITPRKM